MDRPTDELVQRMLSAVLERFGGDEAIDRLVAGARDDAEAEVRELLKGAIKATLLQRAVSRLESVADASSAPTSPVPRAETTATPPDAGDVAAGETACYVYGIARAGSLQSVPDLSGVDPPGPLSVIRHEDLAALTSAVSLGEFGGDAVAERVKDLDWVARKVRAHDRVVKAMLDNGPVIPCRFCTIVGSPADARRVLERNQRGLRGTLDALDGKKEWGVKIYAASSVALAERPFASGRSYFIEKKREEISRAELAHSLRAAAEACHAEMSAAAADSARLGDANAPGSGATRDVLINAAYLVPDKDTGQFHELVNDLSGRYERRGLALELTGPWPPYNFVSLDLSLEGSPGARSDESDAGSAGPEAAA
jgi:hypothetical protein